MTPLERIVEYAQSMAHRARQAEHARWKYGSIYEVLLAHGRVLEPAPLPDTVYPALAGHAFQAATIVADQHALVYTEGLALHPDTHTVIEHAWSSTWRGQVVDPSLGGNTAAAYLGIPFTLQFHRQAADTGGRWSVLFPDQDHDRPHNHDILQHGLPQDATVPLGTPLATLIQPANANPPPTEPNSRPWRAFTSTSA